jgi:hypothetical protein
MSFLKILFSAVWVFLKPFVLQFISDEGQLVMEAAIKVVKALEASTMPGAEKQAEAYKIILRDLQAQGITVATHVINGAIEAAVAKLKVK